MVSIDKNNYEVFFLDYIEGRLNAQQIKALLHFLEINPELGEELEGLEIVRLEPNHQMNYPEKQSLKIPEVKSIGAINELNYADYFVAASEGDLTENKLTVLHAFLRANPTLQAEFDLQLQCRVQPNSRIVFPNKAALKKTAIIPLFNKSVVYRIAIAASLALLLGLVFLFNPQSPETKEIVLIEDNPGGLKPDPTILDYNKGAQTESEEQTPVMTDQHVIPDDGSVKPKNVNPGIKTRLAYREHNQGDTQPIKENSGFREKKKITAMAAITAPPLLDQTNKTKIFIEARSYFSGYYPDISLAQQIRYAVSDDDELISDKLIAQGSVLVKEVFKPGEENLNLLPQQIDLWKVADMGINGFARMTGSDMEFRKQRDNNGRVTAFAFQSPSMNISRSLKKDK